MAGIVTTSLEKWTERLLAPQHLERRFDQAISAAVSIRPGSTRATIRELLQRPTGALAHADHQRHQDIPAGDQSSGPVSLGYDLVQPAPGHLAWRGCCRHSAGREGFAQTPVVADQLSGKRPGLPAIPQEHAAADRRSSGGHLSDPGHSLRKHYPPDHHSLDLALGRDR